ncbi:hypothetical protein Tco_0549605 [Tanacetum coccineum]
MKALFRVGISARNNHPGGSSCADSSSQIPVSLAEGTGVNHSIQKSHAERGAPPPPRPHPRPQRLLPSAHHLHPLRQQGNQHLLPRSPLPILLRSVSGTYLVIGLQLTSPGKAGPPWVPHHPRGCWCSGPGTNRDGGADCCMSKSIISYTILVDTSIRNTSSSLPSKTLLVRKSVYTEESRVRVEDGRSDFGAIWRPVLALESWAGQKDAQRATLWHAISDMQGENRDLRSPEEVRRAYEVSVSSFLYITKPGSIDHNLWDVIVNGDIEEESAPTGETSSPLAPKTAKQLAAKRNQERVKSILLLAILDEYLLKFHNVSDAKSLWAEIKSRFGGNEESKKMQKNVLKHLFENFTTASNESLDKAYEEEDINQKFLRSLPPSWNQIALIMRNKPDIDEIDIDDLYNNLKVLMEMR